MPSSSATSRKVCHTGRLETLALSIKEMATPAPTRQTRRWEGTSPRSLEVVPSRMRASSASILWPTQAAPRRPISSCTVKAQVMSQG